jgi:hypothetical protein
MESSKEEKIVEQLMPKELKKMLNMAKQEGANFAKLGCDQNYMVVNMKIVDKYGLFDLPLNIISAMVNSFRERAPNTGVMFVTVGRTKANVIVNLPKSRTETTASEWIKSTGMEDNVIVLEKTFEFQKFDVAIKKKTPWSIVCSESRVTQDLKEGEFLKFRDDVIMKSFDFLKKNDLLPEEESDEEIFEF